MRCNDSSIIFWMHPKNCFQKPLSRLPRSLRAYVPVGGSIPETEVEGDRPRKSHRDVFSVE